MNPLPPWERPGGRKRRPHHATLHRWRTLANDRAKALGCQWACDLCKRPIKKNEKGRTPRGAISLTVELSAPEQPQKRTRRICNDCWTHLWNILEDLEWQSIRSSFPPTALRRPRQRVKRKPRNAAFQVRAPGEVSDAVPAGVLAPRS